MSARGGLRRPGRKIRLTGGFRQVHCHEDALGRRPLASGSVTKLASVMVVVLGAVLVLAVANDVSFTGLLVFGAFLAAWVGAGLIVKRDAQRLGMDDPDRAGGMVVVLGIPGLLWWFGYRRGRADATRR